MKPFTREGQNNSEENSDIQLRKPFTHAKEENKNEDLIVEIIQLTEDQKEVVAPEIPQEANREGKLKPFTYAKEESENEEFHVEIVRATEEEKEKADEEIPQEVNEVRRIKPFERVEPMIVEYSRGICKQFLGESSSEVESKIALVLQKEYAEKGIIMQNFTKCEQSCLLNFNLNLAKKIGRVYDTENGEVKKYDYDIWIQVTKQNGKVMDFEASVSSEKVKDISWVTRATHSLATIPRDKEQREEWYEKVQCCVESENVPFEVTYPNAGWREIRPNVWRFVYADGVVGEEGVDIHTLPRYNLILKREKIGVAETFQLAIKMIDVTKNSTALELFLFVHMSVMSTLFDKAGFPLKFVFGIVGVTNSRKTSLVLALSQIFGRERLMADAEFATATRCGIEKVLSTYKDGTVVIDDFKPGISSGQQNELNRKLDELVRMYGDRVPKKRMTDFMSDGENKFFPIGGGCVLTMELVTGVTSSITRMFLTELGQDDVQNDRLSFFQENKWILDTHLYDFICWITENFCGIINYLQNRIPQLRAERLFSVGRYDEMRSHFLVTTEIFSQYARDRNFWMEDESFSFQNSVKMAIEDELRSMQQYIRKVDKGIWILRALDELIKRGQSSVKELNENTCSYGMEIYDSKEILYVRPKYLLIVVKEYFTKTYSGINIVSEGEVISALERLEVIEILVKEDGKRERSRKLPIQRGNRNRYIFVKKEQMKKILEDE